MLCMFTVIPFLIFQFVSAEVGDCVASDFLVFLVAVIFHTKYPCTFLLTSANFCRWFKFCFCCLLEDRL